MKTIYPSASTIPTQVLDALKVGESVFCETSLFGGCMALTRVEDGSLIIDCADDPDAYVYGEPKKKRAAYVDTYWEEKAAELKRIKEEEARKEKAAEVIYNRVVLSVVTVFIVFILFWKLTH